MIIQVPYQVNDSVANCDWNFICLQYRQYINLDYNIILHNTEIRWSAERNHVPSRFLTDLLLSDSLDPKVACTFHS
jgi:hypothetical protein